MFDKKMFIDTLKVSPEANLDTFGRVRKINEQEIALQEIQDGLFARAKFAAKTAESQGKPGSPGVMGPPDPPTTTEKPTKPARGGRRGVTSTLGDVDADTEAELDELERQWAKNPDSSRDTRWRKSFRRKSNNWQPKNHNATDKSPRSLAPGERPADFTQQILAIGRSMYDTQRRRFISGLSEPGSGTGSGRGVFISSDGSRRRSY